MPKGQLALTAATRVAVINGREQAFSIATPEMERAGLILALQAKDGETMTAWLDAIRRVLDAPSGIS